MAKNKRKQGDGTVRLRSDGRWEGRVVVGHKENGNPITKNVLAKTKFECEDKLKKLKEECGRISERIRPDMPFGDWMDFWYQNFCKPVLRESTKQGYENNIYKHIIPSIGSIPLISLTQNDLQQFYATLKKQGRISLIELYGTELSNRMVRSCHARCRSALAKAVAEGLITRNPAIGCKLPPKRGRELQVLTQSELARFLARAKEEGYYEFFLLELSTGMRRGEILGLKWSDFDLGTGSLHISRQVIPAKQMAEKYLVQPPKTKSSVRTILLPSYMTALLAELQKNKTCEWIFSSPVRENAPLNPDAIPSLFHRILERAGCKRIRFHDLRHTFATMALENGMDVKTLSAMIGHVSAETTLNIYSHVTDTMRAQAAARIDRKIGGTDTPIPDSPPPIPPQTQTREIEAPVAPYTPKIRKSGTGCIYQVNATLWEGSFSPRLPNGKRHKYNTYAKTRAECEKALAELIAKVKAEIKAEKENLKRGQP